MPGSGIIRRTPRPDPAKAASCYGFGVHLKGRTAQRLRRRGAVEMVGDDQLDALLPQVGVPVQFVGGP
jgi:hypothetical protein